jgi:diguanylate cyclase (GGDEF)-like protein
MQRGDLVRVMIQGDAEAPAATYALRGHTALLDLSQFLTDGNSEKVAPGSSSQQKHEFHPETQIPEDLDTQPIKPIRAQERLLQAMEKAQLVQMSGSGLVDDMEWLDPVLDMLNAQLDEMFLVVETEHETTVDTSNVLKMTDLARPFWTKSRVTGETVWIADARELPDSVRQKVGNHNPTDIAQALVMPLVAPDATENSDEVAVESEIGLLYVISMRAVERDEFLRLGARLSRFVTQSWQQRLLMNRLMHTDPLTGVRNRGFFQSQLPLELERCKRQKTPLVLLLGDLDHFKHINDTYGHPMGDRVLKAVARELQKGLRRIDIVCRVGGEEFVLILPDTPVEAAQEVVTRLQVRIANLRLQDPDLDEPVRVTASFGGVAFPEGGDNFKDLYDRVDEMLYLSKERGRNRCHFWRADGDPILTLPHYRSS